MVVNRLRLREALTGYAFLSPWVIGFLVLGLYPIAMSLYYSLCQYDVLRVPQFIGIENYRELLFDDPYFGKSIWKHVDLHSIAVATGHWRFVGIGGACKSGCQGHKHIQDGLLSTLNRHGGSAVGDMDLDVQSPGRVNQYRPSMGWPAWTAVVTKPGMVKAGHGTNELVGDRWSPNDRLYCRTARSAEVAL